jgi:hypothetical protein
MMIALLILISIICLSSGILLILACMYSARLTDDDFSPRSQTK